MLSQAVGDLLISAVAVAFSPFPIVAVVLVLGTPRARLSGSAFAAGWVVGLTAVSVIVVLLLGDSDDPDSTAAAEVNWLKVGAGVLFLVMAAGQWRKRPRAGQVASAPKWMASVEGATPSRAGLLGLALAGANPKNLALTLTAAASIAEAGLDRTDTAIAIATFVAVGSVTVAGAVLVYLVAPHRAERPLATVKQFMSDNNAVIMMVILLLLGAKLLGDGLAGFWR
jgi:threonine/homoserine/homoserine lactone efflux protein